MQKKQALKLTLLDFRLMIFLSEGYEHKGVIECLWEIFGGTKTLKGYKLLDSHIGVIYGDSVTLDIAQTILHNLEIKGFASENIVFGVGSHTYQYVTRDDFGFAIKATSGIIAGERKAIFKSPKTDLGTKKSAKGLLRVEKENGKFVAYEQQSEQEEKKGLLSTMFLNSKITKTTSLTEIRTLVDHNLKKKINIENVPC